MWQRRSILKLDENLQRHFAILKQLHRWGWMFILSCLLQILQQLKFVCLHFPLKHWQLVKNIQLFRFWLLTLVCIYFVSSYNVFQVHLVFFHCSRCVQHFVFHNFVGTTRRADEEPSGGLLLMNISDVWTFSRELKVQGQRLAILNRLFEWQDL